MLDAVDTPLPLASIAAHRTDAPGRAFVTTTTVDPNGRFVLHVPTDTWLDLVAHAPDHRPERLRIRAPHSGLTIRLTAAAVGNAAVLGRHGGGGTTSGPDHPNPTTATTAPGMRLSTRRRAPCQRGVLPGFGSPSAHPGPTTSSNSRALYPPARGRQDLRLRLAEFVGAWLRGFFTRLFEG